MIRGRRPARAEPAERVPPSRASDVRRAGVSSASLLFLAVLSSGAARAHHSIAAAYDSGRQVTVEGRVSEFLFVNPHPFLVIDVTEDGAAPRPWRLELDNRSELAAIGIDPATFKPGDRVIATGNVGRNDAQSLYAWKVERPADGLLYEQVGYSPRINRPRAPR